MERQTVTIGRVKLEAASSDGVAIISIINPPFNLLSVDVLLNLKDCIEEALLRDHVKAIVITGSNGRFSAGFDVTAFGVSQEKKSLTELGFFSLDFFTDILEASRKPIVAAIEGAAFGGGLEIALACHARISTSSAQLGLTELEYGLIPGLGGTQRLPRLVGIHKAINMIIMSKRVNGEEALRCGLVDDIATSDKLLKTAKKWALHMLEGQRPWMISLYRTDKLHPLSEARLIFNSAKVEIQKRTPNLIHPLICIDVMEEGIVAGPRNGLWKEVEILEELRQSSTCRSLVHAFFAQQRTSKIPGVSDLGLVPRKINKVGLVVEGLEGSDIATILILSKIEVIMKEHNKDSQSDGIHRVKDNLQRYVNGGKITHKKKEEAFSLLRSVENYDGFNDVDVVIEVCQQATTGSFERKIQIFADLAVYCSQCCVFSSTDSLIDFTLIGERTLSQDRLLCINFFSPVPDTRLLEIVCTDKVHPQVITDMIAFSKKIGKTPFVVKGSSGFVTNHLFSVYMHASNFLAEHGAEIHRIDQALIKFGMEHFPEDITKEHVSSSPVDLKLKGVSDHDIVEMVMFPVVNEACRLMAEGIILKSSDVDAASVLGLGFPPFRGGIVFWADSVGSRYVCSRLECWSKDFGELFRPCAYVMHHASQGTSLGFSTKQQISLL